MPVSASTVTRQGSLRLSVGGIGGGTSWGRGWGRKGGTCVGLGSDGAGLSLAFGSGEAKKRKRKGGEG